MSQIVNVIRCKACGEIVEVPPQEAKVVVKTEPCRCGLTQDAREHRYWATAIAIIATACLLCIFGSCWVSHFYTTEQIKALPENFEMREVLPPNKGFPNEPDYKVVPKVPAKPPEPSKK